MSAPRLKSPLKASPIARLRGQKLRPRRGTLGKAFKDDFELSKIFNSTIILTLTNFDKNVHILFLNKIYHR